MKLEVDVNGHATVRLSRRNIASLLAKLDGYPVGSFCHLSKTEEDGTVLTVIGEPDEKHYGDRPYPPGPVHPATEQRLGEDPNLDISNSAFGI